jgi:EAL domain-containing protein (putative c-di-GMP-specific phosphodiesterase class I)
MTAVTSEQYAELARAIEHEEIVVYFQPQVELGTGRVVGAEALSRWEHPDRGLVMPDEFIPMAEATGLIREIGMHVLRESCRCAAVWAEQGHSLETSVNVSPVQLADPNFYGDALAVIEEHAPANRIITIEITEGVGIDDIEAVSAGLKVLRDAGVSVSIDDFGAGHTSVEQLLNLPANELKLDRSLMQDATPEGDNALEEAARVARELGLRVVAEGIESAQQLQRARELGCDRIQGYLIGVPVPLVEFDALHLDP